MMSLWNVPVLMESTHILYFFSHNTIFVLHHVTWIIEQEMPGMTNNILCLFYTNSLDTFIWLEWNYRNKSQPLYYFCSFNHAFAGDSDDISHIQLKS